MCPAVSRVSDEAIDVDCVHSLESLDEAVDGYECARTTHTSTGGRGRGRGRETGDVDDTRCAYACIDVNTT